MKTRFLIILIASLLAYPLVAQEGTSPFSEPAVIGTIIIGVLIIVVAVLISIIKVVRGDVY